MKHKKKNKGRRFQHTVHAAPKRRLVHMEPEELATYVRRAEEYACPRIRDLQIPPAVAVFLLAQYTHVLATGDERVTLEGATEITACVLSLSLSLAEWRLHARTRLSLHTRRNAS